MLAVVAVVCLSALRCLHYDFIQNDKNFSFVPPSSEERNLIRIIVHCFWPKKLVSVNKDIAGKDFSREAEWANLSSVAPSSKEL